MSVKAIWGCEAGPRRANFGDDNVTEPKRPYFNAAAAAQRRAERIAKLKQALGFGTAVVLPVSDETMKRLNNELKSA